MTLYDPATRYEYGINENVAGYSVTLNGAFSKVVKEPGAYVFDRETGKLWTRNENGKWIKD